MNLTCPNCGAPVTIRSQISILYTCSHCRSTLVRNDQDLDSIGQVSGLIQDFSPFQVGTEGTWEGKHFTLAGRIRLKYDSGFWSEWFALFDDGTHGWLAEAQGLYMMSFETEVTENFGSKSDYLPGASFQFAGRTWKVKDAFDATYIGCEGELPFRFEVGYEAFSVDFAGSQDYFANVLIDYNGPTFYVGRYAPFDDFKFQRLRELDGWTRDK